MAAGADLILASAGVSMGPTNFVRYCLLGTETLGGLLTTLEAASTSLVAMVACEMPFAAPLCQALVQGERRLQDFPNWLSPLAVEVPAGEATTAFWNMNTPEDSHRALNLLREQPDFGEKTPPRSPTPNPGN